MDRMPHIRGGWICGLHRCIRKTQTLRFSYRSSLTSTLFEILGIIGERARRLFLFDLFDLFDLT
jgi:hypothetical protein